MINIFGLEKKEKNVLQKTCIEDLVFWLYTATNMLRQALYIGSFLLAFNYFLDYRDWLEWSRNTVFNNKPGDCRHLDADGYTCEDVTHVGNGNMIFSSGFSFEAGPGTIRMKNVNSDGDKLEVMRIINAPARSDFLWTPHGISAWKDPVTGQMLLYVLTHPPREDRIEVFEVMPRATLKYIKTITDAGFNYMNDLVVVGRDQFYITKYWHFRDKFKMVAESLLRLSLGKIFYYNGYKAREVASGFFNPNGINVSPDGTFVYMAEWGRKMLHGFRREPSNNLVPVWSYHTETGLDNIEVDPDTGDLWIGCHSINWRLIDVYDIFKLTVPSQVIRVKIRDYSISEIEEVYADDGNTLMKSTSASYYNGTLMIGTIGGGAAECNVAYLSP